MKKYVISIMLKYDYYIGGFQAWEERFAGVDSWGAYATGCPCWVTDFFIATIFDSIEVAKERLSDWREYLIDECNDNPAYKLNMDSLCIKEVSLKPVYSFLQKRRVE